MKQIHKHIHTEKCANIYEDLCDNLDVKLNSATCKRIRRHIETCENCSALLDSLKKTITLYKTYPTSTPPKNLSRELFAVIAQEKKKKKQVSK